MDWFQFFYRPRFQDLTNEAIMLLGLFMVLGIIVGYVVSRRDQEDAL
ncbi:MAG: hypothetical protein NWE89_16340 [Candidatus Bathyarchaeota archaeon]|nr:hypothetical protein [Candidatus Bathyarchaeota archaeon]